MQIDSGVWHRTVMDGALTLGVDVSLAQARAMGAHARELVRWNRAVNLTAITDPLEMALKHYVDSVAAASWIGAASRVLDAGSGGGFPGLPLKIVRPDLSLTLVDSVRKKISFLKHAIRSLGLTGVDAVHGRLEMVSRQDACRERFDVVVCRAFSSLDDFAALALDFLAPDGCLVALKGPQADHRLQGVSHGDETTIHLGGVPFAIQIRRYRLPVLGSQRRLVKLVPLADA